MSMYKYFLIQVQKKRKKKEKIGDLQYFQDLGLKIQFQLC